MARDLLALKSRFRKTSCRLSCILTLEGVRGICDVIWRRGRDLNSRPTKWAPVFKTGGLNRSPTPPRHEIGRTHRPTRIAANNEPTRRITIRKYGYKIDSQLCYQMMLNLRLDMIALT